ncbi:S8 family serine peptidase [Arsukibacterium sp.]|uniref:S8 family serine peptidase n=1 Tax=Arsukibacterium sp. TaxID=1977258 RepID=UPI00299E43C2|nr:S8 family serine peptidase [Arsukibacterium sp.]MDX1539318.1 S8 family serine peptidase [Arsukibacterium sp.]
MNKALLATAVSLAISGTANAGFNQYRAASGQSVHEVVGNVTVSLNEQQQAPSAWFVVLNAPAASAALSETGFDQQRAQQYVVLAEQAQQQVTAALMQLDTDAQILTTTKNLAAGLVVNASAEALDALQKNPLVASVKPMYDSELHVADSAAYIKAVQTVQSGKATGEGVRVAILDTGIDYTHAALGGAGTAEAYSAARANTGAVSWPQGSVIGGYNFINNTPNPIDPANEGHGTSVANSVNGIAPDVDFYGYKVCAPAPVNCTGLAQVNALEAAMDPNGDGNLADRVDIVNMSLGGDFGSTQTQSGSQFLIQRAVELGVNMVISAGNDGNVPFIVGGPSTTPNALSVGAMTHPSALVGSFSSQLIEGEEVAMVAAGFNPSFDFAFNSADTPLVLVPGEYTACNPLAEDADLTGKAVLVSRGVCAFSQKVLNAQARGAAFVIIANSNPGEAPIVAGGDGTGITIPTVMITKEVGDAVSAMLMDGMEVNYDINSVAKSGAGAVATFTSRGPSMNGLLKPEITAPGVAIMVAEAGSGDGLAPATGTSFSGPMTAGATALVRGALPERNAFEIKATMMNTANMTVHRDPIDINPDAALAPISMIGAGLVDVEKAVNSPVAAWVYNAEHNTRQAALSFGLQTLAEATSITKTVSLKNFSNEAKTYSLSISDRFVEKTETAALSWQHPATVTVQPGQTTHFDVTLTVDPAKLPEFTLSNGMTWLAYMAAEMLDQSEYDGALIFNDTSTDTDHDLHLVYHLLPKAAGELALSSEMVDGEVATKLTNTGVIDVEPFASALVATSPANAALQPMHDIRAITMDIEEASWCDTGYALYPTFHLDGAINHLLQGNYALDLDINADGVLDYTMNTLLVTRLGAAYAAFPGVMVSFNTPFGRLSGNLGDVYHFAGGKQVTLESCFEDVGLTAADIGRTVTARFRTDTNSYSLNANFIADQVITPVRVEYSPQISLVNELNVADAEAVTTAADEEVDNNVEVLTPGQSAYIVRPAGDNRNYVMMSAQAEAVAVANFDAPIAQPVVDAGQTLSVAENAADGTVVGQISATVDFRTVVTEFVTLASSSDAVRVQNDGSVVVANSAVLDFEAGMTEIQMEVAALDSNGNMSAPVTVTVNVNNIPDEQPAVTVNLTNQEVLIGSAAGTVLGNVSVDVSEAGASLVSVSTNNPLFKVENGQLKLARMAVKSDVRVHTVTIAATDSSGMRGTVNTQVTVNKGSSGSFGIFALLLLPLALLRRRTKTN